MKTKRLMLSLILVLISALAPTGLVRASAQDFYFTDFTADYYLIQAEDGTSRLHVKEVLTAVFPETDQNHGINRTIPVFNQDKKNRTVADEEALNLVVLRNGAPENIAKIVDEGDYYNVYIGNADIYVHGEQIYTLEYDFTNVITEFDADLNNVSGQAGVEKLFQELYWDTNGTDWSQHFERVTANLHMPAGILQNMLTETWCYVGKYGARGAERCTTTALDDGVSFTADDLRAGENLTFVVEFEPDTFVVIIEKDYILIILLLAEIVIAMIVIIKKILKWKKEAYAQSKLYHALFTTPQYQPPENSEIHVAEGEQIYLKKVKLSYVATLLELAVAKKVTIVKITDLEMNGKKLKGRNWLIHVNADTADLSLAQTSVLKILANKVNVAKGDDIVVQKYTATAALAGYARGYKTNAEYVLDRQGYLSKKSIPKNTSGVVSLIFGKLFLFAICMFFLLPVWEIFGEEIFNAGKIVVGVECVPFIMMGILFVAVIADTILTKQTEKYARYTEEGIRLVKYLEGLELYIGMAEADRLKFLQSVEGADTSNAGIVKLYEKLLPWASLFGLEESWMKELAKYYEIEDVQEGINIDVLNGIITSNMLRDVNSAIKTSTSYTSPSSGSGGGGSSFSSGGGGGGFSGGGGGGGGGGGW